MKKKRVKLGVTLPTYLIKKVNEIEKKKMINKSKLIEHLLKEYMEKNPN